MNILTMKPSEQVVYVRTLERQAEESDKLAREWEQEYDAAEADYGQLRKAVIAYVAALEKRHEGYGKTGTMAKAYGDLLDVLYGDDELITFPAKAGQET